MNRTRKEYFWILTIMGTILMFVAPGAQAQSRDRFPARSIDIIVPTVPGGGQM